MDSDFELEHLLAAAVAGGLLATTSELLDGQSAVEAKTNQERLRSASDANPATLSESELAVALVVAARAAITDVRTAIKHLLPLEQAAGHAARDRGVTYAHLAQVLGISP